jgi:hypothetical protein
MDFFKLQIKFDSPLFAAGLYVPVLRYIYIYSKFVHEEVRSGGFNPVKNAKVCCLGSNSEALRPADILSDGDRIGSQVCIDVTVVSNMSSSRGMEYRREMEYRPLKITITINIQ